MSSTVLTSLGGYRSPGSDMGTAGGPSGPGPPARDSSPRVRVDVDVVDGPGAAVVLGIEDDLHCGALAGVPQPEDLGEGERLGRRPARAGRDRTHDRLVGGTVADPPAQCDVEHAPGSARALGEEPERGVIGAHAELRRDHTAGRGDGERLRVRGATHLVRLVAGHDRRAGERPSAGAGLEGAVRDQAVVRAVTEGVEGLGDRRGRAGRLRGRWYADQRHDGRTGERRQPAAPWVLRSVDNGQVETSVSDPAKTRVSPYPSAAGPSARDP